MCKRETLFVIISIGDVHIYQYPLFQYTVAAFGQGSLGLAGTFVPYARLHAMKTKRRVLAPSYNNREGLLLGDNRGSRSVAKNAWMCHS